MVRARSLLAAAIRALLARRRARTAVLCTAIAAPLLGGGWVWLRHSPLVSVERVSIVGVHGPEAAQVRAALTEAARRMSTLDVRTGALRTAVVPFGVVAALRAIPSFPHGLRIVVSEQLPVADLIVGSTRTAVAADGVVLGAGLLSSSLPTIGGRVVPVSGGRLREGDVLACLTVLGAAPAQLGRLVTRAYDGPQGVTLTMHNGLTVYFGDATRAHAKWLALASVLADSSSAAASYVDVRLPTHPAAGFPAGAGPSEPAGAEAPANGSSSGSTVSSLAAALNAAGGTSSTQPSTKGEAESEAPREASGREAAPATGETGGGQTSETSAARSESGGG